jgi:response regulator of citrate/malate metabolism
MTDDISVLVVDDDYHVARVHAGFVERMAGFRVVGEAHTAAEAIAESARLAPDLVLMDIYLPDGDGLDVTRTLLARPQAPAVIVVSAARDAASLRTAVQLGAVHYLVKPFGFSDLADRLIAFREARTRMRQIPEEATQADADRIFGLLRAAPAAAPPAAASVDTSRLAPTLRLVYSVVAAGGGVSATDVATHVGISRATAQRALAQLEQSGLVRLDLRYGSTGRPEHRYSLRG